jgi:4-hydroxy-L-threonine phosphate dehydrogenase PdxA
MNIILSIGDCNGIGLETFYKAVHKLNYDKSLKNNIHLTLAGNKKTIQEYFNILNLDFEILKNQPPGNPEVRASAFALALFDGQAAQHGAALFWHPIRYLATAERLAPVPRILTPSD